MNIVFNATVVHAKHYRTLCTLQNKKHRNQRGHISVWDFSLTSNFEPSATRNKYDL